MSRSFYYGHVVVFSAFLFSFVSLGIVYSAGLYIVPLQRSFGTGRGVVGFLPSLYLGTMLLTSFLAASTIDWLNRRNERKRATDVRWLFGFGSVTVGAGIVGGSYASNSKGVIGSALVTGAGLGFTAVTSITCVQPWFHKKRGMASGLAFSGSGAGNFVQAIAIQRMMSSFERDDDLDRGWGMAMRIQGLVATGLLLIATFLIRLPREGEAVLKGLGENVGGMDDGDDDEVNKSKVEEGVHKDHKHSNGNGPPESTATHGNVHEGTKYDDGHVGNPEDGSHRKSDEPQSPAFTTTPPPPPRPLHLPQLTLFQVLCTRSYASLLSFRAVMAFGYLNFYGHLAAFAVDAGVSAERASVILSMVGAVSIVGRLLLGYLADRYGRVLMLRLSMFSLMVTMVVWPFCGGGTSLWMVAMIFGFNAGGNPSLPPSIVADYYGKTCPDNLFKLVALTFTVETPGLLIGVPVVGFLFDSYGSYYPGAFFTAVMMLLSNVFLWMIPSLSEHEKIISRQFGVASSSSERP